MEMGYRDHHGTPRSFLPYWDVPVPSQLPSPCASGPGVLVSEVHLGPLDHRRNNLGSSIAGTTCTSWSSSGGVVSLPGTSIYPQNLLTFVSPLNGHRYPGIPEPIETQMSLPGNKSLASAWAAAPKSRARVGESVHLSGVDMEKLG